MKDAKSASNIFKADTWGIICNSSARWKEEEGRKERKKFNCQTSVCTSWNVVHFQTATSENANKKIELVTVRTTRASPSGVSQVCCCGQWRVIAHQHKRHSGTQGGWWWGGGGGGGVACCKVMRSRFFVVTRSIMFCNLCNRQLNSLVFKVSFTLKIPEAFAQFSFFPKQTTV